MSTLAKELRETLEDWREREEEAALELVERGRTGRVVEFYGDFAHAFKEVLGLLDRLERVEREDEAINNAESRLRELRERSSFPEEIDAGVDFGQPPSPNRFALGPVTEAEKLRHAILKHRREVEKGGLDMEPVDRELWSCVQ